MHTTQTSSPVADGRKLSLVPEQWLSDGGELGALVRTGDWSKTELGPIEQWPASLRTVAGLVLRSRFPMLLWWGKNLIQLYNDAYRPILGDKHPRSLGAPGAEVWKEIWPVIGPMAEGILRGGSATWSEHLLLPMNRKGFIEETYFTFSYSPVPGEAGALGGVLVTCQETTQQVLGERRLRTLQTIAAESIKAKGADDVMRLGMQALQSNAEDLPFAVLYLVDKDGVRATRRELVGVDEHLAGPQAISLDDAAAAWPLHECARTHRPVEVPLPPPATRGKVPCERAVVLPIEASAGGLAGFLVVGVSAMLELDEKYRAFLELVASRLATALQSARAWEEDRKRAEALAELDRAKTTFFSNVSHEFRTPLTLMLGPLEELLRGAQVPPGLREELSLVHRNGVRLLKLVNTLLDFARIEAGRVQARYEPTELSALTAELASVFRSAAERAGLALRVDCPPLPEPVYVDRELWEKIVLNLLSNALKFTFDGELSVSLRWQGARVELEVRDTGVGIPPEELPNLFTRFHRVQGARARTHEGSGIGLALVHELVKLHGGELRVQSTVSQGSTFTASIPTGSAHLPPERIAGGRALESTAIASAAFLEEAQRWLPDHALREAERTTPLPTDASSGPPQPPREASQERVLLADDNADMREYLTRLLSPRWTIEAVANGAAALEAARAHLPDLVLADVMMPELDGFGLLRALREDPRLRAVPVVLLSARAGEEARVEGLDAGADDYLVKPFTARELVARVASQLALAKLRGAIRKERDAHLEELARTVRTSELFVGILSHDLRNPLSSITTAASLLVRRSEDAEKVSTPALRILSAAERMRRMIDQLLDFTRARLGSGLAINRTSIDLAEVCRAVMDELEGEGPPIQLHATGDTRGEWDSDRVAQLLSNLLSNAAIHGAPGAPIDVRLDGRDAERLRLEVHNQGTIARELLPGLFEPFRMTERKLTRSGGLGLGLFITQQIALAHGGHIDVESTEAAGTTFIVALPRSEA